MFNYKLKINSIILSLNSVLTVLPEYFIATSILSMAIFFSVSQKIQIQTSKKANVSFFSLSIPQLNYLAILIIFFYCYLCLKQNFLFLSDFVSFNNAIHNNFISVVAKLIIGISSIVYLLFIQQYLTDQKLNNFEYYIIILTAILGLCLLCCSDDLLTAYLAIELQGLSFYILASFKKTSNYSVESGVKYFILGSFSTVLFLFGINLIYGFSGSMSIMDFKDMFTWNFSSNSFFFDQNSDSSSILKSLLSFHAASILMDELTGNESSCMKYEMVYDIFTVFPEQALNVLSKETDLILYYDLFQVVLEEKLQKDEESFLEELKKSNLEDLVLTMDLNSALVDQQKDILAGSANSNELLSSLLGLSSENSNFVELEAPLMQKNSVLELGLFIVLMALFFKLALSPFHLWSPDIYEGSPSSSTFFFTVISKLSIFILLLKLCYVSFYSVIADWQFYILFVALLSIMIGAIAGLKQRKFKSLLAYSSISNMGLILVSFSTGNFEGIKAIFYYFIIYILSGLAVWSIFLLMRLKKKNSFEKHNKDLGDFSLLKESNGVLAYASVITIFTVAGIPPTVGFLAKINIFLSLTTASMYFIAVLSIVSTVISTFYYIRILKVIFFENILVGKLFYPITSKDTIVRCVLFFLLIFLFICPNLISLISYKTTLFLNSNFY